METENEIYFYALKNKFAYMSNFYKINFTDKDGITYNCSEQYFMYNKCKTFNDENEILLNRILSENSPAKIKVYGRQVKNYDNDVWNKKRYKIMLDALRLKFSQNEIIKQNLLSTNDKILYEAAKNDKIWGIGFDATTVATVDKSKYGTNLLGKALMEIRNELRLY